MCVSVGNEGLMSVSVEQEKYFAAVVSATPAGLCKCTDSWMYVHLFRSGDMLQCWL